MSAVDAVGAVLALSRGGLSLAAGSSGPPLPTLKVALDVDQEASTTSLARRGNPRRLAGGLSALVALGAVGAVDAVDLVALLV